jgi:outer membrane protein assembly factor BamB
MTPAKAKRDTTLRLEEIAIWRTKLPGVNHAILPPDNDRPNPLVVDSIVYVSVFAPGAVCALDRKTGKLIWRKEIPKLAGSAVHKAGGKLFAKTAHTLYALDPYTGTTTWSFCPYGDAHEWIYSAPTIYRNSVFLGDRRGYLHCLDVRSGRTRWAVRTSRAKNDDVNSTPIVLSGLVIAGTNASKAFAYDPESGKRVWVRPLDGPSVLGPFIFQGLAAVFTDSIYLLKPESGAIVRKFSWRNDGVTGAASTPKNIIVSLKGQWPPSDTAEVVGLNKNGIWFSRWIRASVPLLRYSRDTKLLYISHLDGIYICRPETGELIWKIRGHQRADGFGPVEVKNSKIYALSGDGHVYALRHPSV